MELSYAILSEKAGRLDTGHVCIFGADVDGIDAPGFLLLTPISLVIKLLLYPDEDTEGHSLKLVGRSPSGEEKVLIDGMEINTTRNGYDGTLPSGASILVNIVQKVDGP